jgi:diguanylate cyclase (GGDEF)-like protein
MSAALDVPVLVAALGSVEDRLVIVSRTGARDEIIFANGSFAEMVHRSASTLAGMSLAEVDTTSLPAAVGSAAAALDVAKLYRRDGRTIDCERRIVGLPGGMLALTYRPRGESAASTGLARDNGLSSMEHLLETLRRDWSIAQRDHRTVTVMRIDVDAWREYQDVFGRGASDSILRQVTRAVAAANRRASDLVSRKGDAGFLILCAMTDADHAHEFAAQIVARVRSLAIHHPRSTTGRYLTVSAGVASLEPPRDHGCEAILAAAAHALREAQLSGGNRSMLGGIDHY